LHDFRFPGKNNGNRGGAEKYRRISGMAGLLIAITPGIC